MFTDETTKIKNLILLGYTTGQEALGDSREIKPLTSENEQHLYFPVFPIFSSFCTSAL